MLQPMGNRILVEMDESIHSTFYIPPTVDKWQAKEGAVESYNRGKVVAIGPGKRHPKTDVRLPMMARVGDIVRFSELEYPSVKEGGKTYALISEADIVGVEE